MRQETVSSTYILLNKKDNQENIAKRAGVYNQLVKLILDNCKAFQDMVMKHELIADGSALSKRVSAPAKELIEQLQSQSSNLDLRMYVRLNYSSVYLEVVCLASGSSDSDDYIPRMELSVRLATNVWNPNGRGKHLEASDLTRPDYSFVDAQAVWDNLKETAIEMKRIDDQLTALKNKQEPFSSFLYTTLNR